MKLIIDLSQSPIQLKDELTKAVRLALGANFYIEEATAFTAAELADPATNIPNVQAVAPLPPVQAAAPAGATPGAVETDSEGHPHDIRIHSSGKSKITNGTWKLAKGMSTKLDFVAQINAQNKSLMATPLPTAAPTNVVQLPPLAGVAALPNLPPVVAALPELPPVVAVAGPEVEIEVTDYPTFAAFVAQQMLTKPTATKRELDKGLTHYQMVDAQGTADITALQHRPEAVMPLYQWLKPVLGLCQAG